MENVSEGVRAAMAPMVSPTTVWLRLASELGHRRFSWTFADLSRWGRWNRGRPTRPSIRENQCSGLGGTDGGLWISPVIELSMDA